MMRRATVRFNRTAGGASRRGANCTGEGRGRSGSTAAGNVGHARTARREGSAEPQGTAQTSLDTDPIIWRARPRSGQSRDLGALRPHASHKSPRSTKRRKNSRAKAVTEEKTQSTVDSDPTSRIRSHDVGAGPAERTQIPHYEPRPARMPSASRVVAATRPAGANPASRSAPSGRATRGGLRSALSAPCGPATRSGLRSALSAPSGRATRSGLTRTVGRSGAQRGKPACLRAPRRQCLAVDNPWPDGRASPYPLEHNAVHRYPLTLIRTSRKLRSTMERPGRK
jgi:hypothetical protein